MPHRAIFPENKFDKKLKYDYNVRKLVFLESFVYKNIINSLNHQLHVLDEKKRIAENLKRCLQQIDLLKDAPSAASSSLTVMNQDSNFEFEKIDGYLEDIKKVSDSMKKNKDLLKKLNQHGKINLDKIGKETYTAFIANYKEYCGLQNNADFSFDDFDKQSQEEKQEFWDTLNKNIISASNRLIKNVQESVQSTCPYYKETVEGSRELTESVVKEIRTIISETSSLSEEEFDSLLNSFKDDYISLQQATALFALLSQLKNNRRLDDQERDAFCSMLTQYSLANRKDIVNSLSAMLKLNINTAQAYSSAFVSALLWAGIALVVLAASALIVAVTVYLGIRGFSPHGHHQDAHGYGLEPTAVGGAIGGFFALTLTGLAPISAAVALISAVYLICTPFFVGLDIQANCQRYQSSLDQFKTEVEQTRIQLIQNEKEFPDFDNVKLDELYRKAHQLSGTRKVSPSSRFFQEAEQSVVSVLESNVAAKEIINEIDEQLKEQSKANLIGAAASS